VPIQNATSFAAPNPYKLVITLSKPYAPFLDGLAKIDIVAPNKLGEVDKTPVGTGPFKFVSWTPNSQIVLTRNNDYFGAKPAYKTLILKPITDTTTALTDLAAGNVDIVATLPPTSVAQVTKSVAHVVHPQTSNSLELVEFNSSNPATSNPLVRRALSYALDKNAVNKIAYNGLATPTWSPVPPTSFAYKAETGYNYNLTKAKQLLAQAKDPHPTLTFIIPSGYPDGVQLGRVWQSSLAQIGVKLNVDVMPLSAWLTKWLAVDYEISWNTFPETSDPGSFYTVIMSAHQHDFKDAAFYSEMAAGVSTTVQSQRKAIYGELQDQLVNEDPVMIVMREPELSVASNKVSGYVMNSLGFGLFAGVKVAK
jgi:peptide/nickel transport system substrate-binding protein